MEFGAPTPPICAIKRRTFRLLPASTGLSYVRLIGGRLLLTGRAQARCASHHKLGIQTYKGRAARHIATLFEQAAWFERSLRKAGSLARVHESVRSAWRSLRRDARHASMLPEPITRVGDSHHALDGIAQNFEPRVRNLGIGPAQST